MGELHLEIYVERMKREYNTECITGKPRVAYRETITQRAEFNYTHKKQTGGAGQYAKVVGYIEPMDPDPETGKDTGFESVVMGGNVPSNYIPAVERVSVPGNLPISSAYGNDFFVSCGRDSMRHWRKERFLATRFQAVTWFYKMVPSTLLTPLSWHLDLLQSALTEKHTRKLVLLSLNLS